MANIELWAIDLSWDILARFVPHYTLLGQPLPREFIDDFVQVAVDETKHFRLLCERLKELGSYFGALSVHNGECGLVLLLVLRLSIYNINTALSQTWLGLELSALPLFNINPKI